MASAPPFRASTHQLLLLVGALALAGGLYALPKGIVKPKESKATLNRDATRTARPDGGGAATNGDKTDASSGPRPAETGTVADDHAGHDHAEGESGANTAPHTQATADQRRGLSQLLAQYRAASGGAARRPLEAALAKSYTAVQRFDSAGYYLAAIAMAQPGAQAWQQAAEAYLQAAKFATKAERKKQLDARAGELFQKVLKLEPGNLSAKADLGLASMTSDTPMRGVGMLREVLEQDSTNEKVLYYLGTLAIESNQYDKAVGRFTQLVRHHPQNVEGQFYLGVMLARTKRGPQARAAFARAKALSNDPALAASIQEELAKLTN